MTMQLYEYYAKQDHYKVGYEIIKEIIQSICSGL